MNREALLPDWSLVLLLLVAFASASIIVRSLLNGVPPMPSLRRVRAKISALMREIRLPQHGTVVELGSGWGSVSLALSRAMPSFTVFGYENSPLPFLFSVAVRHLVRASNLRLERRNFYTVSLREADLVFCYLSPAAMARLEPKLAAELKASAVVLSSTFALPAWRPTQVVAADDLYRTPIYVYRAGICRSGTAPRGAAMTDRPSSSD